MSDADETRVLNMRINNKEFLKGTTDSLKAIDTLNKGIDGAGKGKGMQGLSKSVDTVKSKFSAMQIVGVTALATITNKAVNAGINMVKSLTIAPILGGFREYEKLLTSTQTIMANTGSSAGKTGKYLDELNRYSDQTIYNFGQMADNIGRFTAAMGKGSIETATTSIKGLANSAALAGSDANQLNTAMYQMSQAMSTGTIKLMDWNSLANAGMGGDNMQMALKATAMSVDGVGESMVAAIKKHGSFRESLTESWLSAEVFSKTMKVMGGQALGASTKVKDLNKLGLAPLTVEAIRAGKVIQFTEKDIANLSKRGFNKAQIASLEAGKSIAYTVKQLRGMGYSKKAAVELSRLSGAAIESATKIKTFSQLMDVVKESIESGWAGVFRQLFGNLTEAGKLWTNVGNKITGTIDGIFRSMQLMLQTWHDMEDSGSGLNGFQMAWAALGNIMKSIGNILSPVIGLISAILPSAGNAGTGLFGLTKMFYEFSVLLEKTTSVTSGLTPVINVLAKVLQFLGGLVVTAVSSFVDLFGLFGPLGSAALGLVTALGELLSKMFGIVDIGSGLRGAFDGFIDIRARILTPLIDTLAAVVDSITTLVNGDMSGFKSQFKSAFSNLAPLANLASQGKQMASDLIAGLRQGWDSGSIQSTISGFVSDMLSFFKGLLGINSPSTVFEEYGRNIIEGLINGLKSAMSAIGGVIGAIGDEIKGLDKFDLANIMSAIFGGTAILVAFKFVKAFKGAFAGFAQIGDSFTGVLDQAKGTLKSFEQGVKAKALLSIAIAIGVLAGSLWVISKIPGKKLAVGLASVGLMLRMLTVVMSDMAANAATTKTAIASLTAMAVAMVLMGTAVLILSAAVLAFGSMPVGTLVQGLLAVGAVLLAMSGISVILGKAAPSMILAAGGILILSVALAALAPVILLFANLEWSTIISGLAKMAVVLVVLGAAMAGLASLGPVILITAAALVVLGIGLASMAGAISLFAGISWGTIISGVAKIAVALVVVGAAALVAAPGLILLGVAAVAIGAGLLMAGVGMALFGAGLTVVAAAGAAAAAILITAFEGFLAVLPLLSIQLVAALSTFLGALAQKMPEIIDSVVKIGTEMLRGLRELGPELADTAVSLLDDFIGAIVENQQNFFDAGIDLIQGFLETIEEELPKFIETGTNIIVAFITGIGEAAERITTAAGETILSFLTAIDAAIVLYMPQIIEVGKSIAQNLVLGLVRGLVPAPVLKAFSKFVDRVIKFFKGLLGINSPSTVFAGFGRNIVEGLINGVRGLIGKVISTFGTLVSSAIGVVKKLPGKARDALSGLGGILKSVFSSAFKTATSTVTKGVNAIKSGIGRLPGIISGIIGKVSTSAKRVGSAIVAGIKSGLSGAVSAVGDLGGSLLTALKTTINSALNLPFNIPKLSMKLGKKTFSIGGQQLIPRFAKGTTNFGGGTALVGEVGPELVTMNRGSNVITNKSLSGFMKQVAALTKVLTSQNVSKNSSGGNIQYVVSAAFRGNPKASGTEFAANLTTGLVNGLRENQSVVDMTAEAVGLSMSQSFADILGIQSPSKVFKTYAGFVGKGFINGLLASVAGVQKAARALGRSAITEIAKTITDGQLKLEALRGKANAYANAAELVRERARKTKSKKRKARLEKEAKALDRLAKKEANKSASQQRQVDAQNEAAQRRDEYRAADTAGRSAMKKEDAATAASKASAAREQAIRLSKEADLVRKYDKARAKKLDQQAKAALARSKVYAAQSATYAKESYKLAIDARTEEEAAALKDIAEQAAIEAADAAAQIQSVTAEDVAKAQAAFDDYAKAFADAQSSAGRDLPPSEVKFEQNNYSPEAISPAEAYRNGKTLVSIMERKLVETK